MKIKLKTPRTEMVHVALLGKMASIYKELGEELGVGADAVDTEMTRFAAFSARVDIDQKDGLDFEQAIATDTAEKIKEKFLRYVDTQCYSLIDEAMRQILSMDMPLAPEPQQPQLPTDASKK